MQSEDRHDDLTTLFERQDEALQSEAFVERVMTPIYRRARWRAPFLFGAGGIGVGAALSQVGGLWEALKANAPKLPSDVSVSFEAIPAAQVSLESQSIWVVAAAIIILGCAALVVSERA
ncbi:MAG: hypothetical protein AAGL11_07805 [Pseudomonadota bacterium]